MFRTELSSNMGSGLSISGGGNNIISDNIANTNTLYGFELPSSENNVEKKNIGAGNGLGLYN